MVDLDTRFDIEKLVSRSAQLESAEFISSGWGELVLVAACKNKDIFSNNLKALLNNQQVLRKNDSEMVKFLFRKKIRTVCLKRQTVLSFLSLGLGGWRFLPSPTWDLSLGRKWTLAKFFCLFSMPLGIVIIPTIVRLSHFFKTYSSHGPIMLEKSTSVFRGSWIDCAYRFLCFTLSFQGTEQNRAKHFGSRSESYRTELNYQGKISR